MLKNPAVGPHENEGAGALFWFDWQEISRFGHAAYARFVYRKILPFFNIKVYRPEDLVMRGGQYDFYDGDVVEWPEIELPAVNNDEAAILEKARLDYVSMYVVAVFSHEAYDFSPMDARLKNGLGFVGMTSCPGMSGRAFYELTGELALPFAFRLYYDQLMPESFGYLPKEELQALGFFVRQPER